ncbi:MAG: hypothetical protein NVS9B12_13980 [Vulcanimicrobiaceae bacterium]
MQFHGVSVSSASDSRSRGYDRQLHEATSAQFTWINRVRLIKSHFAISKTAFMGEACRPLASIARAQVQT